MTKTKYLPNQIFVPCKLR